MMNDIKVLDLKVGDRIGVSGSGWEPIPEIRTVAKRTPTQAVLDDGTRWNKYGRKIGDGSTFNYSYLLTVEEAQERRADALAKRARMALVRELRDFDFKTLKTEALESILRIAKEKDNAA